MTPKEKAKELIEKYSPLVTTWDCYNDTPTEDEYILRDAKKCAIILVDEINDTVYKNTNKEDSYSNVFAHDYWNAVKQELELL